MRVLFRNHNPILLRVALFLPLLGMLLTGCATQQQTLRVALFPYIPDAQNDKFSSLTTYLENAFQRANPGVDLQLRPLNPDDEEFYDAKVKVLSEQIEHHVGEEEKRSEGIFAQARAQGLDMDELADRMKVRKKELMAEFKSNGIPAPETRTFTGHELEQGSPIEDVAA